MEIDNLVSDKIKELYRKYPFPSDNPVSLKQLEKHGWILNSLPSPIKKASKILDAGCGTGEISCFLSKFGEVTSIDFSENSIKLAKELKERFKIKNLNFILDDLTNLKHNKKYDYIFSIGVLHHIPKIHLAIENLKSLMHKDSFLIISVYNRYSRYMNILLDRQSQNKARKLDAYHHPFTFYYTNRQMIQLLERHNLKIVGFWRNIPRIVRLITGKGKLMTFCVKLKDKE